MGLLSFFQRKNDAAPSADAVDGVTLARTRARQRLVGAAVLVVIGVIGFPLIFETQPRPIPVDIPIEIPRKDNAAALVMPPARIAPAAPASAPVVSAVAVAPVEPVKAPAPVEPAETKAATKPEPKPEPKAEAKPTPPPADAARAKALLEDKPIAKAAPAAPADAAKPTGRFVVQAGAFTDAAAVSETRAKLDKIGLKSFTQPVETASGTRTRVRVGPFSSREEAEQALAKARAAGLSAVVLTL